MTVIQALRKLISKMTGDPVEEITPGTRATLLDYLAEHYEAGPDGPSGDQLLTSSKPKVLGALEEDAEVKAVIARVNELAAVLSSRGVTK